jgi:hypothetical protein
MLFANAGLISHLMWETTMAHHQRFSLLTLMIITQSMSRCTLSKWKLEHGSELKVQDQARRGLDGTMVFESSLIRWPCLFVVETTTNHIPSGQDSASLSDLLERGAALGGTPSASRAVRTAETRKKLRSV